MDKPAQAVRKRVASPNGYVMTVQGRAKSVSLEPVSPDCMVVHESEEGGVDDPGGSPTLHTPLHLTEEQAPYFSQLPNVKLPNGCWALRVKCSLPTPEESFVCNFDSGSRAVRWMQAMLEEFQHVIRYVVLSEKLHSVIIVNARHISVRVYRYVCSLSGHSAAL